MNTETATKTPRVDAEVRRQMEESNSDPRIIGTKFARQLETELLAAQARELALREAASYIVTQGYRDDYPLSLDFQEDARHNYPAILKHIAEVLWEALSVPINSSMAPCVPLAVHQKVVEALEAAVPHLDTDRDLNDEEVQGTSPTLIARRAAFRLASAALSEARKGMV